MAEKKNATVCAVLEEVTSGTLVWPSAATDYIALQNDYTVDANVESIVTDEIRSSIGKSKAILGNENPNGSLSHYIRASGTTGVAPNYGLLLKSLFGAISTASTEYDTVASSTTTVVKVNTGEGSTFERGEALLVQDSVNGYSIRPIYSISGDDLTLAFALPGAPAAGVLLGKCVLYKPADTGHAKLSIHFYEGNGGAHVAVAGSQVNQLSMDVSAGEIINGSFDFEGTKYFFNPILIGATDTKLDFFDGTLTMVATITAKTYQTPHELAAALQTSMNAQGSADTFTVVYNDRGASAGKFTISSNGSTLSLLWNTGANTANSVGDKIGYSLASNDTGSLSYNSDSVQSWAAAHTPTYDSNDPDVAKSSTIYIGDATDNVCIGVQSFTANLSLTVEDNKDLCADSGVASKEVTVREDSVDFVATLTRHDADLFDRFINNTTTRFMFASGKKSGGNFVKGKCFCLFIAGATLTAFKTADSNGIVTIEGKLTGFVDSDSLPEIYLGFV